MNADKPARCPEDPANDLARLVRTLNRRFEGWSVWHGGATGRWWAVAPRWGHDLVGLVEAGTPEELVLRMNRIEQSSPYAACDPSTDPRDLPEPPPAGQRTQR
ncbi:hypothetical protein GCM10022226_24890 [Sphaerisporangium flaviroseum]|uniref:Uncharacterized protein n=1 Tax=Sphaerisporangium flaviroseum TaxID=509199 RepID=A0ABP7HW24_9ACTN